MDAFLLEKCSECFAITGRRRPENRLNRLKAMHGQRGLVKLWQQDIWAHTGKAGGLGRSAARLSGVVGFFYVQSQVI